MSPSVRDSSSFSAKYLCHWLRSKRKLGREHKKKRKKRGGLNHNVFSPPPLSLFICSRPNFLNEPARKRLLLRLSLSETFTPIIKVSYPYVCILPTGRSFLIVLDLRRASWPLLKGCHPLLYPAFPLEVFQVVSFLLFFPQLLMGQDRHAVGYDQVRLSVFCW